MRVRVVLDADLLFIWLDADLLFIWQTPQPDQVCGSGIPLER